MNFDIFPQRSRSSRQIFFMAFFGISAFILFFVSPYYKNLFLASSALSILALALVYCRFMKTSFRYEFTDRQMTIYRIFGSREKLMCRTERKNIILDRPKDGNSYILVDCCPSFKPNIYYRIYCVDEKGKKVQLRLQFFPFQAEKAFLWMKGANVKLGE